jgi:hypothetical protein
LTICRFQTFKYLLNKNVSLPAEEERTGQNTEEPEEEFKKVVLLSPSLHESKHVLVFGPLFGMCSRERSWKGEYSA